MDRAMAIAINQAALARIVAALIAMASLAEGGEAGRLPQTLYRAVLRVLRPAESAVRRLIVLAACGLKVKLSSARPMPKGLALARKGAGRLTFQLFDPRKRFAAARRRCAAGAEPRVHFFGVSPLSPLFQPRPVETLVQEPDDHGDALRLGRRLAAVKSALDTLPRQAKRLARWQARRDRMQGFIFRSPLRPGPPPGHRKEPEEEIDLLLSKCHALAWEALNEDTS
ncbi:hypothetical protein BH10PSE7_BH10PSE7_03460 [soil metagenome]